MIWYWNAGFDILKSVVHNINKYTAYSYVLLSHLEIMS